jgi:hypothetical protein
MKDWIIGFGLLAAAALSWLWVTTAQASESNQAMKWCLEQTGYNAENFETFDFRKAAACHSDYRVGKMKAEYAELRDFLKHNPRYRYPGQSNNRCWGKPREMPFESAYIERTGDGFKAGVSYKDTLPAGCYENAPWDNRDD